MLDFKNLGSFVVLAEELNYTRAADRLGITQSALTYRIQRLEQDVGAVLIERGSRRSWELTPAGALFFGRMQSGLQQLETALREVQRLGSGEVGELLVGIMPSISPVLVCYAISALRSKLPEIRTSIRELAADEQLDALRRGISTPHWSAGASQWAICGSIACSRSRWSRCFRRTAPGVSRAT